MTPTHPETLSTMLSLLDEIHGIRLEEAQAKFEKVRSRILPLAATLLWNRESYDGVLEYSLLVHWPTGHTAMLSLAKTSSIPWPLRGAQRWSDSELCRLNATVLRVQQAVTAMDFIWEKTDLTQSLLNTAVLLEYASTSPVTISDSALQVGMDAFRRRHKLLTVEETDNWLGSRGMSHSNLERVVEDILTVREIRRRIAADSVEGYYEEHHADFDQVIVSNTWFNSFERALAHIHASEDKSQETAAELDFTVIRMPAITAHLRSSLSQPNQASLLSDSDGAHYLREPIEANEMFAAARVVRIKNSPLDESVREHIENKLFRAWIDLKRTRATVTWNWGNVFTTARSDNAGSSL